MIQVIEVPYGSLDISNINVNDSIPISVEVVPHKAYLIEDSNHDSYLNFQLFRLSENRINRDIVYQNRQSNHRESIHRENSQNLLKRIKCILYTMVSIPITILLLGYVSTIWNRR
jgi:hypothetical protein